MNNMEVFSSKRQYNTGSNEQSVVIDHTQGSAANKHQASVSNKPQTQAQAQANSAPLVKAEVVSTSNLEPQAEQEFGVHAFQSVGAYEMMVREVEDIETFVPAHEIKSEYKKWADGEVSRGMFLGFCNTPGRNGNMIPSVRWMTVGGKVFHHSGEILVSDARGFNLQEGTPIEIRYLGYKETKSKNKAMNFSVLILRRPTEKV
jgi:hypothetical protein